MRGVLGSSYGRRNRPEIKERKGRKHHFRVVSRHRTRRAAFREARRRRTARKAVYVVIPGRFGNGCGWACAVRDRS